MNLPWAVADDANEWTCADSSVTSSRPLSTLLGGSELVAKRKPVTHNTWRLPLAWREI